MYSPYEIVAAKRYRIYRWEKRRESLVQQAIVFLMQLLRYAVEILQGVGIAKKQHIEKIKVE